MPKVKTIRRNRYRRPYIKEHIYRIHLKCKATDALALACSTQDSGWMHCSPKLDTLVNFAAGLLYSAAHPDAIGIFIVEQLEFELYARLERNAVKDEMLQWNGCVTFEKHLDDLNRCVQGAVKPEIVADFIRTIIIDSNKLVYEDMQLHF